MDAAVGQSIAEVVPEVTELRHELHRHPEIRFEEVWTSDRIARFLADTGIPYRRGLAKGTGIIATIQGPPGKTLALRTDIDALEISEETGLPYASRIPNRMHACGHDGHMSILCGVAKVLARNSHLLNGTVRLLFQPGEEQAGAARYMVEEGAVDGVDAIFGLHGWPGLPLGQIAVKPGPLMAGADFFRINITGKGCHGADPAAGIDPIIVAAHITTALQSVVSRELDPLDPAVLTVAHIRAGSTTNITPDSALIEGTIRSFNAETHAALRQAITRIAENTALAFRATAHTSFGATPYPPLVNDPTMTRFLAHVATSILGPDNVITLEKPVMIAEDFACYLRKVPGSFFFLGVNPSPDSPYPLLHSPTYDFNDAAIPIAIQIMTALALDYLA